MALVGLAGAEFKLPGEISGGMRKRAGLARALVLDPEILLFDEPDSGLDPVRTSYLDQLIVDLNAQTGATYLIVTHNINTARSVPDNIGLLYRRELAMFGPRSDLLTSEEPVVLQFMNGRKEGPIGMSEEKDAAELAAEAEGDSVAADLPPIEPQMLPSWPLVRPSMGSPHGSHAFLRDPSRREDIPFSMSFGENGLEPSDEPPARAMSVEDFWKMGKRPTGTDASSAPRPASNGKPSPGLDKPPARPRPSPVAAATAPPGPAVRPRPTPHASPPAANGALADSSVASSVDGGVDGGDGVSGKGGRKSVLAGWRGRRGDRLDELSRVRRTTDEAGRRTIRDVPGHDAGAFQLQEFIEQAWFIASVTILPTMLVSIPFGAVIALQLGNLATQIGASPTPAPRRCWPSFARRARSSRRC